MKRRGIGLNKGVVKARHAAFVEAYLETGNAREAAERAGYSPRSAKNQGPRLAALPHIKAEIERRRAEAIQQAEERTGLHLESVLRELAMLVHLDPRRAFREDGTMLHPSEWPDDLARAVSSIEVVEEVRGDERVAAVRKVRFWDKNAAIVSALRHLGGFKLDNEQKPAPVMPPSIVVVGVNVERS